MKKAIFTLALFCLALISAQAQKGEKRYAMYGVAFYNLENLFDTIHDEGKNDFEYLPDGANRWGTLKYTHKLRNMSKVLSELCRDKLHGGPAFIGMSEIENRRVLEDLLKQPSLKNTGWRIVHEDGPDRRGVECAFFYNPRIFQYESHMLVPYYYKDPSQPEVDLGFYTDRTGKVIPYKELKGDTTHITRGFLVMSGRLAGEKVHAIVCHWPSRFAGSPVRERAGEQVCALKNALLRQDPGAHIIIMGDMNDDPENKSLSVELGCKHNQKDVKGDSDMFNPWWDMLYKVGQGTLMYNGKWNLFDQIVFNGTLIGKDRSTLKYLKCEVFNRSYLFQSEGRYKGGPLRTHAGGTWLDGYSDHLPTCIYLVKEKK
ncbi:MAG: endonuclease/exonuclease/phosphatase family protein [Alloprevotella sp.]|nr:endonuclease/exonuclease/phosphatase family protein [Alloprevotella sp.]